MSYRLLMLPNASTMTPKLLRKVHQLVKAGATVIGPRPEKSPSLSGYPHCDVEVARLARDLWGEKSSPAGERNFGRGRVVWNDNSPPTKAGAELEEYGDFGLVCQELKRLGVEPDFASTPFLRYLHRRIGETDLYFVANPEDSSFEAQCEFRVTGKQPELWDSVTGSLRDLPVFEVHKGRTTVPISFAAHQAFFVVFRRPAPGQAHSGSNALSPRVLQQLTGPWSVSFDPRWGGPAKIVFDELQDWSKHTDPAIRSYSGQAIYRQSLDLPSQFDTGGSVVELDLGVVKNLARVRLNGVELGVVWCAPWRIDITSALKAKGNELEITIANLWPNRLIADSALPAEKRLTSTTWNPFQPDSPLLESGLLGPVKLLIRDNAL
jgi:hypothetical protein